MHAPYVSLCGRLLQVRFVGMETACILAYLHSVGVLYRDLKPENLLLDADGHVSSTGRPLPS